MKVAVSEACANAIEHSKSESTVELTARLYVDRAEIDINSQASFELPTPEYLEGPGRHRGMGLPLMAKLSDHLAFYSHPEGGTQVTLTFYLPGRVSLPGSQPLLPRTLVELLQSEERLEMIFAHMSEGLIIGDGEGHILHTNPAAARITGSGQGEVGRSAMATSPGFQMYLPTGGPLPESEWPLLRATRGETFRDLETEIHKQNGEVLAASYAGVPIMDETGRTVLTVVTLSDITDRKQGEAVREQLLASERRLTEELSAVNQQLQARNEELAFQGQKLEAQNQELRVRSKRPPVFSKSRTLSSGGCRIPCSISRKSSRESSSVTFTALQR